MEIEENIKEKAQYCLKCKMKPCSKACPMHTNIPVKIAPNTSRITASNSKFCVIVCKISNIISPFFFFFLSKYLSILTLIEPQNNFF